MTDCWKGYQGVNSQHEFIRTASRSKNRRPPSGPWHPSVPSWEKKFCSSVCLIPWGKLCETKKMMEYCFKNIVEWNASAGEEALQNAKARFWAMINGLPCNISLPDPDIYIDKVDWNCIIDPELVADLERLPPPVVDDEEKDEKLGLGWLGNGWDSNQPIPCTGWGDEPQSPVVDDKHKDGGLYNGWDSSLNQPVVCSGWDDLDDPGPPIDGSADPRWGNFDTNVENGNAWDNKGWGSHDRRANDNNGWDCSGWESRPADGNSWENGHGNSRGWGRWESSTYEARNTDNWRNNGSWATWNGNGGKREGGARFGSRHSTTRFQAEDCQVNGVGRNYKGRKRSSFVHERQDLNKRPLAPSQWISMGSCGPVTHNGPTQAGNAWSSWEKPVS